MSRFFNTYATPLITGFFIVSLISGIALFFHIGPMAFHGIHEWLSMVLILAFALHLWKNWRPMAVYFKRAPMAISLAVAVAASALFFIPTSGASGGPAAFGFASTALKHSADEVAPLFDMTGEELRNKLTTAGYAFATPDQPLTDVATAAGKDSNALLAVLMAPTSGG